MNMLRGDFPLRQFLFSLGGRVGFWQKKEFNAPRAMDLRVEINIPQAEQNTVDST